MTTVHFIHGITDGDLGGLPAKYEPQFKAAGFQTFVHENHLWGPLDKSVLAWAIASRWVDPRWAKAISKEVGRDDILFCHSNGCTVAWEISNLVPVKGLVLLNPALDEDIKFNVNVDWVDVYFCPSEDATEVSEVLGVFDLVKHPWGRMGRTGYIGSDARISNINTRDILLNRHDIARPLPSVNGHSDLGKPMYVKQWGPYFLERVREHLKRD